MCYKKYVALAAAACVTAGEQRSGSLGFPCRLCRATNFSEMFVHVSICQASWRQWECPNRQNETDSEEQCCPGFGECSITSLIPTVLLQQPCSLMNSLKKCSSLCIYQLLAHIATSTNSIYYITIYIIYMFHTLYSQNMQLKLIIYVHFAFDIIILDK